MLPAGGGALDHPAGWAARGPTGYPAPQMIVNDEVDELLLVTQPDHARFAAQLLSLFRLPELREHPRRQRLLAAVREHDNGWREADAAPRLDPAGRPFDFRSLPGEHRREIWRRGVERFAQEEPYAALLMARHSWELHHDRRGTAWKEFLAQLAERRQELLEAAPVDAGEVEADYRWLELADALSLAACCRSRAPLTLAGFDARFVDGDLEIEPFPLAGATTFQVPARRVANRAYAGEADLAGTLGAARWIRFEVRCRPRRRPLEGPGAASGP